MKSPVLPTIMFFVLLSILGNSCSKNEENNNQNTIPSLYTKNVSGISDSSATVGGVITSDGGTTITERGICFAISSGPTVADYTKTAGIGTGTFECTLTGLDPLTTYYYKAYAMNDLGTGYGDEKSFTTEGGGGQLPIVTTDSVIGITQNAAISGGEVIQQGISAVIVRGICWSTSQNPTTIDQHTADGSGTGSFTSNLTGLTATTQYYIRAYATNNEGTAYGTQLSFTTLDSIDPGCQGVDTVNYHGQTYHTIEIGAQCWFRENLNYETGNSWCYENDPINCTKYGRLYDWDTFMNGSSPSDSIPSGVQGICPDGWHAPSYNEWIVLADFLGGVSIAGGKMKSIMGWYYNGNGSNSSGFTALPGGWRWHSVGSFNNRSTDAFFSATSWISGGVYRVWLTYSNNIMAYKGSAKEDGLSVRCLKD